MLRIRLSRGGKRNNAKFRVTVADGHRAPSGKFIEILGHYDPHTKEKVLNKERIEHWLSKGVKPSATVYNLLVEAGIIKGDKVTSWAPKKKPAEETEKKEAEKEGTVAETVKTEQ